MRKIACIAIGLLVAYLTLVWVVEHLGAVSSVACSPEFTLPAIACRVGGLGITLLLVPVAGVIAFLVARRAFAK